MAKIAEKRIFLIRCHRVMISNDLASLYQVLPKTLIQSVKRNIERFPADFMFQLTLEESNAFLRSQFVTLKQGQHIKHPPYAFTEQGVAMLSSVLKSKVAVQVNIEIMRTFLRVRENIMTNSEIIKQIENIERKVTGHDKQIQQVFKAMRDLIEPASSTKRPIGIRTDK